jgi:porphobilinogen deaminase
MTETNSTKPALTLGAVKNVEHTHFVDLVQQTLENVGINAAIQYFDTEGDACNAVIEGHISTYACPLDKIATALPMGLVITALSERKAANNCLIYKNGLDEKDIQKVLTLSAIDRALMQYLQADYVVEKMDITLQKSLELLDSDVFDAVVFSQSAAAAISVSTAEFNVQPFSVREFTPSAGQGVVCFITAEDDLPTRRLLKAAHHPSVSALTNIERTVQKMLKNYELNAYCERDRMGNYHLWVAALVKGELCKTRISQSTSFGMAEKATEQLLSA